MPGQAKYPTLTQVDSSLWWTPDHTFGKNPTRITTTCNDNDDKEKNDNDNDVQIM
jgi:hypothetical protein